MYNRPSGNNRKSRSVVHSTRGMVAASQPLAAVAGLQILQAGGNAFDASVATAAVLCVVEPMMTGLGGDMFAITYHAETGEIKGMNASGRAPELAHLDTFRALGFKRIPETGIYSVSVPGVVDGWAELLDKYGTMTFAEVLAPAIHYAEHGFPVSEMVAYYWRKSANHLLQFPKTYQNYSVDGVLPKEGTVFKQPDLAKTLKQLAEFGRDFFYQGDIADRIEECMLQRGGLLRKNDLIRHRTNWVTPISTSYRGYEVLEIPPNGQGLVVLEILNILEQFDVAAMEHNSAEYIHLFAQAKKLAYQDRDRHIADSEYTNVPVDQLLSKSYAQELADRIRRTKSNQPYAGAEIGGDTVYLTVADSQGNIASVTNSIFHLFGSGELVDGTGIVLQNRGSLFSLDPAHPNVVAPCKRPFHTIIPSMVLQNGKPVISFGVMGADMQPQGQVQVLVNMIDFGMNIQEAGEAIRIRHYNEGLYLEYGVPQDVREQLQEMDYKILSHGHGDAFGVGGYQGIRIDPATGSYQGGSDPRKDGCAIGY